MNRALVDQSNRSQPALHASGLGKRYVHHRGTISRLRELMGLRARREGHWALAAVSFELHRGQCLGVVGDNGAGKSTLLKLLAGTIQPSVGSVACPGRVTAILELGAGFHPEFSGRENLLFAGSLIGIGPNELRHLEPEILAFAELGDAIERPVKTYSSGMVVRLAFALVTAVQPEVLIIDEALAVGDQAFQRKCTERITAFRKAGCTILFCSHSLYHVRHLCDQVMWLDQGKMRALGETEAVLAAYEAHVRERTGREKAATRRDEDSSSGGQGPGAMHDKTSLLGLQPSSDGVGRVNALVLPDGSRPALVSFEVLNVKADCTDAPWRLMDQDLTVRITARMPEGECPSLALMIEQAHGVGISTTGTHADSVRPRSLGEGVWQAEVTFPELPLHTGEYVLSAYLFDEHGLTVYEEWPSCARILQVYPETTPGLVRLPHRWT